MSDANDMVTGLAVKTSVLVISLRAFICEVFDLEAVSCNLSIPRQGLVHVLGSWHTW